MALLNVTHITATGRARQFDGSLDSFLDIINARGTNSVTATIQFDGSGAFVRMSVTWPDGAVTLAVNDWVIFPDDGGEPVVLPNALAPAIWHAS